MVGSAVEDGAPPSAQGIFPLAAGDGLDCDDAHVGSKLRNILVGVGVVRDWASLVIVVAPLLLVRESLHANHARGWRFRQ